MSKRLKKKMKSSLGKKMNSSLGILDFVTCVFKPLGTTVKKEVRIEVERWEKMVGYVA